LPEEKKNLIDGFKFFHTILSFIEEFSAIVVSLHLGGLEGVIGLYG